MSLRAQIFFPASRFDEDLLRRGIEKAEDCGITISCPSRPTPNWFQCGSKQDRLQSFLEALKGDAQILWAARGGFGTAQWLSELPEDISLWKDKRVVGFSDLTALHAWMNNRNLPSFHAPMIATKGWCESAEEELRSWQNSILKDSTEPIAFTPGGQGPLSSGRLVGGNLTVLASLMGSPHQLQLHPGDLLFLEDLQEPPYRLARSLLQLSHSPNFHDVQIIWGQLTHCGDELYEDLVSKLMETFNNPWGMALQVGHGRPNHAIRLGAQVQIQNSQIIF